MVFQCQAEVRSQADCEILEVDKLHIDTHGAKLGAEFGGASLTKLVKVSPRRWT